MAKHYLAVDSGASSERTIAGTFDNDRLTLKEIYRFWNGPTQIRGTLHWDSVHLFHNIKEGIALALLYANTCESLEALTGRTLDTLRIVGGGFKNELLNQIAANATGRKVITGPVEATASSICSCRCWR